MISAGDVYFEKSTKAKQLIRKAVYLSTSIENPKHLYHDIVGVIHRVKTDGRSAVGKTRPPYEWKVDLQGEITTRFHSESEAKAWVTAVLKLTGD